jgi:hypothetical protein
MIKQKGKVMENKEKGYPFPEEDKKTTKKKDVVIKADKKVTKVTKVTNKKKQPIKAKPKKNVKKKVSSKKDLKVEDLEKSMEKDIKEFDKTNEIKDKISKTKPKKINKCSDTCCNDGKSVKWGHQKESVHWLDVAIGFCIGVAVVILPVAGILL